MRSAVVLASLPLTLALFYGASTNHTAGVGARERTHEAGQAVEVRRIRAHFDSVLTELAARDVRGLNDLQAANRGSLVETLRAYRDRGLFPHNYDFPGQPTPYFVDRQTGVLCAVGHLLASTGRRDLVDRVAQTDNNIWVPSLAGDTAFGAWLGEHGLTLAEAARIQVPYVEDGSPVVNALGSRETAWNVGAGVAVGASAALSFWNARGNADGHRRLGTALGLTTGVLSLALGSAALSDGDAPPLVTTMTLAAGAVNTWLSTRGLLRHRRVIAQRREAERRLINVSSISVAPIIPMRGEQGAGLAVRIQY